MIENEDSKEPSDRAPHVHARGKSTLKLDETTAKDLRCDYHLRHHGAKGAVQLSIVVVAIWLQTNERLQVKLTHEDEFKRMLYVCQVRIS